MRFDVGEDFNGEGPGALIWPGKCNCSQGRDKSRKQATSVLSPSLEDTILPASDRCSVERPSYRVSSAIGHNTGDVMQD